MAAVNNSLELGGDHDWSKVQLTAGQAVSVALDGLTLADSYLTVRHANGTVTFQNDDGRPGLNALLAFTPAVSGTYYIDVGAAQAEQTGQLSVAPYTLAPIWHGDDILWRNTDRQITDWLGTSSGGFAGNAPIGRAPLTCIGTSNRR